MLRRLRGPDEALRRIDARLAAAEQQDLGQLEAAIQDVTASVDNLAQILGEQQQRLVELQNLAAVDHGLLHDEFRGVLRALATEEPAGRRRLYAARDAADYEASFTDRDPLVSVTVVTRDRTRLLIDRTLPSLLRQTHANLEVIVIGDAETADTQAVIAELGDDRVSYANLTHRVDQGADPWRRWLAAATLGRNEATRRARGRWLVCFDDDDELRPEAIERLLATARSTHAEVVYGLARSVSPDGSETLIGTDPPVLGQWTFAAALYHRGLGCFEREHVAASLSTPGDWFTAERMLRAGVRFAHTPEVLADIYPAGPRPPS